MFTNISNSKKSKKSKKGINHQMAKKIHNQKGDIVISAILVIVILAVIGLFAYKTYEKGMEKTRVNSAVSQIQEISQGIQQLYANSHDFSTIDTATVIAAGIADKSSVVSNKIIAPWYSGNKDSIVDVLPATNPTTFTIQMAGIPKESCSLVAAPFISQGTTTVSANGTVSSTPADLAKNCATKDPATISISF